MKKLGLFILLLCLVNGNTRGQSAQAWYKTFTGKIAGMNAVLHLAHVSGYSGYLWFSEEQRPVQIWGEKKGDSLILASTTGPVLYEMHGRLEGNSYRGNASFRISDSNSIPKNNEFIFYADSAFTPLKIFSVHSSAHLSPKLKNASTFSYDEFTVWPVQKSDFSAGIESAIRSFREIPKNVDIRYWLFRNSEKQRNNWQRKNNKLTQRDAKIMGLSLSEAIHKQIMVMYENEQIIILADFNYAYTGGAHGNYATSLKNISKKDGAILSLSGVLTKKGMAGLPKLLEQVAREQFDAGIGTLKDNGFFVDQIPVSEEFYITGKGIGFLYPPYELRSFAGGEINLFVPFKYLIKNLRPDFNP